jgi:ribosomal protein L12E/L44/L45/RPP1/RPP2
VENGKTSGMLVALQSIANTRDALCSCYATEQQARAWVWGKKKEKKEKEKKEEKKKEEKKIEKMNYLFFRNCDV